ncbi:MAG: FAD-dependent oxidoreductase [Granulosicoccus sp.]
MSEVDQRPVTGTHDVVSLEGHGQFDVLVIGGGISGAWVAFYSALAGYKTALIEAGDFGAETSSASSKVLHGGIRYLQQLDFRKVRESTMERAHFMASAPHVAKPVDFLVPTFPQLAKSKLLLTCAMHVYELLGWGQKKILEPIGIEIPRRFPLNTEELNEKISLGHMNHTGAIAYPEFHIQDTERTVWSVLDSARASGAIIANYTPAREYIYKGKTITGVMAYSESLGKSVQIDARLVVNAAGPWVDRVNSSRTQLSTEAVPGSLKSYVPRFARGLHLVTRPLSYEVAVALTTRQQSDSKIDRGGRHVFVIPWRGCSLIGTSYTELETLDHRDDNLERDINQLIEIFNELMPTERLTRDCVHWAYHGLYPLRELEGGDGVYRGTGEYVLTDNKTVDNIDGLITALGAKFTTGRVLGQKSLELVNRKFGKGVPHDSLLKTRLGCSEYQSLDSFRQQMHEKYLHLLSEELIDHLVTTYGSDMDNVMNFSQNGHFPVDPFKPVMHGQPDIYAQIFWAVENELPRHLDDILLRRTSVGLLGITSEETRAVCSAVSGLLRWDDEAVEREIAIFEDKRQFLKNTVEEFQAACASQVHK